MCAANVTEGDEAALAAAVAEHAVMGVAMDSSSAIPTAVFTIQGLGRQGSRFRAAKIRRAMGVRFRD